ncbi:MAG: hypothetical protein IJ008_03490 [Clostridia bacterium]|nr:hypothetical protein [Clostridia bacterium]
MKEIGDVKKNIQYDVTINLLEFSPSEILEITECSIKVTGKTGITNIWSTTTTSAYYVFGIIVYIAILLFILPPSKNNKNKSIRIS